MSEYQQLRSFKVPDGFRGRSAVLVQLWWIVYSLFFRISPQFLFGWRRLLLRLFGARIGKGVKVRSTARITYPWKVAIGDWSWIGDDVVLYSLGDITIGDDVVISQRSYLAAATHDYTRPTFDILARPIVIERDVWLATDVYVGPGVTVGAGAVVSARSSVFADLPGGMMYKGTPAVACGERPRAAPTLEGAR